MRARDRSLARQPAPSQAMGWSERVRREDIAAFEARARAEGQPGYRVFDRDSRSPRRRRRSTGRAETGSTAAT